MNKIFQILGVSSNTNSFGLHGVIVVAKDGLVFEFGVSQGAWHPALKAGQHVTLDLVPDAEINADATACYDWASIRVTETGARFTIEIPKSRNQCPAKLVKKFWKAPANTQNKARLKATPGPCGSGFGV